MASVIKPVVLIEDNAIIRTIMRKNYEAVGIRVVAEGGTSQEAERLAAVYHRSCWFSMDIQLAKESEVDGVEAVKRISGVYPDVVFVFYSGSKNRLLDCMIETRAVGFVYKGTPFERKFYEDLVGVVQVASEGGRLRMETVEWTLLQKTVLNGFAVYGPKGETLRAFVEESREYRRSLGKSLECPEFRR